MRVVIAEDSVLLREGLVRLLTEYDHEVVAALGDAHHLIDTVTLLEPDLTIGDVRMPPTSTDEGLRAAVELRAARPGSAVLMLSQYVEERYARELAAGGTVFDPEVIAQLVVRSPRRSRLDTLTPREREILDRMAQGRSNTAIARDLVVSDGAVEKHISSIFVKLGLGLGPDDTAHRRVLAVLAFLHDD